MRSSIIQLYFENILKLLHLVFCYSFIPCVCFLAIKLDLNFHIIGFTILFYEVIDLIWGRIENIFKIIILIVFFSLLVINKFSDYSVFLLSVVFFNFSYEYSDLKIKLKYEKSLKIFSILLIPLFCLFQKIFFITLFICSIFLVSKQKKKLKFSSSGYSRINLQILVICFLHNFIYFLFIISLPYISDTKNLFCFLYMCSWLLFFAWKKIKFLERLNIRQILAISFLGEGISLLLFQYVRQFYFLCLLLVVQGMFSGAAEKIFYEKQFIYNKAFYLFYWKIGGIAACIINLVIGNGKIEFIIAGCFAILASLFALIKKGYSYDFYG